MSDESPRQLWIIESGEYSDFQYLPLSFPADFDMQQAAVAFRESVPRNAEPYTLGVHSLSGFLCRKQFGAHDLEPGEVVRFRGTVMDPIHYGNWRPDKVFPWVGLEQN